MGFIPDPLEAALETETETALLEETIPLDVVEPLDVLELWDVVVPLVLELDVPELDVLALEVPELPVLEAVVEPLDVAVAGPEAVLFGELDDGDPLPPAPPAPPLPVEAPLLEQPARLESTRAEVTKRARRLEELTGAEPCTAQGARQSHAEVESYLSVPPRTQALPAPR